MADYTCRTVNRIFACIPETQGAYDRFVLLQAVIQKIAQAMVSAGYRQIPFNVAEVALDGRPGPTTTVATKFIAAVFAAAVPPPPAVAALLDPNLSAEDGIRLVAEHADTISTYFATVFRDHPEALRNDPVVIVKEPPRKRLNPKLAVPAIVGILLASSGLVGLAIYLRDPGPSQFS